MNVTCLNIHYWLDALVSLIAIFIRPCGGIVSHTVTVSVCHVGCANINFCELSIKWTRNKAYFCDICLLHINYGNVLC